MIRDILVCATGAFILSLACTAAGPGRHDKASVYIALDKYYNNDGISFDKNRTDGNYDTIENPAGSTYPAEEFPEKDLIYPVLGVNGLMILTPDKADGSLNNISCSKQILENIRPSKFLSLYFVGSGVMGDQEGIFKFRYRDGTIEEKKLLFPDWCEPKRDIEHTVGIKFTHRHNHKGEDEDITCSIYCVKASLDNSKFLDAIQLPDNSNIHIFALSGIVRTCP